MRVFFLILLSFFSFKCFSIERALLIGIGTYPDNSGWSKISSVNDVDLLKGCIKDFEIITLTDKQATHDNIIKAIENLINILQPGDSVLVHFSCHGQRIITYKNNEPDMLDEALVAFDAKAIKSPDYVGQYHLLDDKVGNLIKQVSRKIGPAGLVVVTLDACYSDSMDKGEKQKKGPIYRGGNGVFGKDDISQDSLYRLKKVYYKQDTTSIEKNLEHSDIVWLSACKTYQKNMEVVKGNIGYGSLSYAMYTAFTKYDFSSVEQWLDVVYEQMQKDVFMQTPQVRTTLNYHFPNAITKKEESSGEISKGKSYLYSLLLSFTGLLAIYLIWKTIKRK